MSNQIGISLWNQSNWQSVSALRREMDRLFDDLWATPTSRTVKSDSHFVPACDVEEDRDHFLLNFEMPGISRDDIHIEVVDNQVVVSGERRNEKKNKQEGTWYSERQYGKFRRSFTIPNGVDSEKIEADYRDGILSLMIPKTASTKPRQIKIGSSTTGTGFFGKLLGQTKNEKEGEYSNNERKFERSAS